jgi:hypothetical protein
MKMPLLMIWACMLLLCACSTVRVSQDYRLGTNFSDLKTYRWQPVAEDIKGDAPMDDPLRDERIRKAVERNLSAMGFRKVSEDRPDFFIEVQYSVYRVSESNDVRGEVGIGTWGGPHGSYGGISVGPGWGFYTRQEGMLHIDVIDPQSGTILWRGKGTHSVEEYWKPQTKSEKINELVGKVLSQFPPSDSP